MVFLSVLLGVGVDYFIVYLFLLAHCWSGILKPPPLPCPIALTGCRKAI